MDIGFEIFLVFLADRYSILKLKISFKVFGSTVNFFKFGFVSHIYSLRSRKKFLKAEPFSLLRGA